LGPVLSLDGNFLRQIRPSVGTILKVTAPGATQFAFDFGQLHAALDTGEGVHSVFFGGLISL